MKYFFTFQGRMRRISFLINIVITYIVVLLAMIVVLMATDPSSQAVEAFGQFLTAIIGMAWVVSFFSLLVRRVHDLNLSGWFSLVFFIPIFGLLYLLFAGGTNGANQYGEDPR